MVIQKSIDALRNRFGAAAKGPEAKDTADETGATKNSPVSRAAKTKLAKAPPAPPAIELKVGPHTLIESKDDVESKSAQKLLSFYGHGTDTKNKAGDIENVTAVFTDDKKEMLVHLPPSVASAKLANPSIFKRFTSMFSSFKVNDALKRLESGNEIDLISEQNEPTDPKLLRKLTEAGVYSFIAVHKTNEKGNFPAKADLLIPVMNLHAMLEYLQANPPKGIDKKFHAAFREEIGKLELNPDLKGFNFIDEALALEANKGQYESPDELRKVMCCAADLLTLDKKTQVLVSTDLIGKGEEAHTNDDKHIHAIDYHFPVVGTDGSVSVVEHPLSLYRHESLKDKPLPKEIVRLLQWHFMVQLKDPRTIDKKPESLQAMQDAFEKDTKAILAFDRNLEKVHLKDQTAKASNGNSDLAA